MDKIISILLSGSLMAFKNVNMFFILAFTFEKLINVNEWLLSVYTSFTQVIRQICTARY